MISICLPTRGRPEAFKRMCLSVLDNASNPNDIEFVIYRDNDDNALYEYVGNYKEVRGERIVQSQMFNKCQNVATGPLFMWTCDDIYFVTKNWDKMITETFNDSKDKIIFVHPNDRYHRSRFGVVGFLHKNWIDTVGYFLPPYFSTGQADKWINDLANIINRRVFLREVRITNARIINDSTHETYLANARVSRHIYRSKKAERDKDARLLQNFIDNYGKTVT